MIDTTKPTYPFEGDLYYDDNLIYIYMNGEWRQFIAHRDISYITSKKTKRSKKIKRLFN